MKLHYIYISIGIITMVLNLSVILHFIRYRKKERDACNSICDEVITFRLSGTGRSEKDITEPVLCDDTEILP